MILNWISLGFGLGLIPTSVLHFCLFVQRDWPLSNEKCFLPGRWIPLLKLKTTGSAFTQSLTFGRDKYHVREPYRTMKLLHTVNNDHTPLQWAEQSQCMLDVPEWQLCCHNRINCFSNIHLSSHHYVWTITLASATPSVCWLDSSGVLKGNENWVEVQR